MSLNVTEGQQVFVNRVLLSGMEKTKPKVVESQILVHPGDPLDQTALLQTQRNLYNIALFNEVVAAVQNPAGDAPQKNVLLQLTEAKRWNVTYGFGFEAQTGTPQSGMISEASCIQLMLNPCNQLTQEGKTGVSPRVSLDVSRINLWGTENSLTLHSSYGLLEQVAILTFQNPHFYGSKNLVGGDLGRVLEHSGHYDVCGVDAAGRFSDYAEGGGGGTRLSMTFCTGGWRWIRTACRFRRT